MILFLLIIIIILTGIIIYLLNDKKTPNIKKDKVIKHISKVENDTPKQLSKSYAIALINQQTESNKLSSVNTSFSTINKTVPIWWFNIAPEKFESDLNLILTSNDGFIWVFLPEGSVSNPKRKFRFRDDKGLIEIKISTQTGYNYLRDESSGGIGFGFEQFVKKEFKI